MNHADTRNAVKRRRQQIVLDKVAAGSTVRAAVEAAGVSRPAYDAWRRKDDDFCRSVERAKAHAADVGELEPRYDGSFQTFRKVFFGMETYGHHLKLVQALDSVKPREIVLILMWPEAGKTTTVEDWVCLQLAREPNLRIADVSESVDLTRKIVGRLKARMTDMRDYGPFISRFGPFYEEGQERHGKPWARDYFTVAKSRNMERDYSFQARSIDSRAYGSRIDILLIDDVISDKNVNQSEDVLRTLRRTYLTRGKHMKTIVVGTRIDVGDVYEMMIEAGMIDRLIEIPAVDGRGKITTPEWWVPDPGSFVDQDELYAEADKVVTKIKSQMENKEWSALYLQNPYTTGSTTFAGLVDGALDHDRTVKRGSPAGMICASLDPALGGACDLLVAEHTPDRLVLLDNENRTGLARTEDILDMVEAGAIQYAFQRLIVETDGLQKGLANDDRLRELGDTYGFEILPHQTGGRGGKKVDSAYGVASMAGDFIKGDVRIPYGDAHSRDRFRVLVDQLRVWRPDIPTRLLTQDAVMALWFNWRQWKLTREAMTVNAPPFQMRGLPWEPTMPQIPRSASV